MGVKNGRGQEMIKMNLFSPHLSVPLAQPWSAPVPFGDPAGQELHLGLNPVS